MAFCLSVDVVLLLSCLTCFFVTYATSYQEYTLTNPRICSPSGKKGKIKLTDIADGAIVEETRSFDNWSGHVKFHCVFEVKDVNGDKDHAVFAVIQNLKLRKSEGRCIDYVEFEDEGRTSGPLCGEMGPSITHLQNYDDGVIAPYAFIGSDEINVSIYVAREKLLPGENLDLKIVFTSARKCQDSKDRWIFQSRSLTPTIPCGDNTYCISSVYANDTFVNCPYSLCKDEAGCSSLPPGPAYHRPGVGTRMTIGAITTVLASFLLFFACIWILRHYRKLCWSSDFSGQREVRMTPVPPMPPGPDSLEAGTARPENILGSAPSAPPLDSPVSTIIPDKDLPPPYDSLFPPSSR